MHTWGDEGVDWEGINDAAEYIGHHLRKYARLGNSCKEKWGTVRVSILSFGWYGIYPLYRPSYYWYPTWWPMKLDFWLANTRVFRWLNTKVIVPVQKKMYVFVYKRAVQKWPHLYKEIVSQADYGELFEGHIPGYKHSDYWTTLQ